MNKKICKNCKKECLVSEEICDECGFDLEEVPSSDTSSHQKTLKCHKCGKEVSDDMIFCDGCGTDIYDYNSNGKLIQKTTTQKVDTDTTLATSSSTKPHTDSSKTKFKLKVVEGMKAGKEYLLIKDEMLIGRLDKEENIFPDIDLENQDDGYVSRKHAILRIKNNEFTVEDLGGINGTMIDNKPIDANIEVSVLPDQVFRVGKVGLMLLIED